MKRFTACINIEFEAPNEEAAKLIAWQASKIVSGADIGVMHAEADDVEALDE